MNKRTIVAFALSTLIALATAVVAWQGSPSAGPAALVAAAAAASAVGVGFAWIFSWFDLRTAHRDRRSRMQQLEQTQRERDSTWERNVADLEAEIERMKANAASAQETRRKLAEAIGLVRETQPIVDGLAKKAIEKSERGSTSLTEEVYELGKQSTSLSESISGFLTEMSVGEESLEHNIGQLSADIGRLSEIAALHDEANSSLDTSITKVSHSVGQTSELLGQVSDIAEQTSILAINAAIYAAKAGEYGPGFSVIAGEIQDLAKSAKEVAETIGANTDMIERQMAEFSETHRTLMSESQANLSQTIESIRRTIDGLQPKVERISGSVHTAAGVSEWVTEHLNDINMAMQEQDAIQQIVSHIAVIVREALEQIPDTGIAGAAPDSGAAVRDLARQLAAKHFTMKDEFVATGQDGYEEGKRGAAVLEDGTELGGDVTLF
jgi:methyl-accepting chemotaxis protein